MVQFTWGTFAVNDLTKDGFLDTIEMTLIANDGDYTESKTASYSLIAELGEQSKVDDWNREKSIEVAEKIATREKWHEELENKIDVRKAKDSRLTF